MSPIRKRFEAWVETHYYLQDIPLDFGNQSDGEYDDSELQTAFEAYSAGAGEAEE